MAWEQLASSPAAVTLGIGLSEKNWSLRTRPQFEEGFTSLLGFTGGLVALEKEMATHSSVLAWRIPGTGEPGGLCLWGCTESDTTEATQQQQQW